MGHRSHENDSLGLKIWCYRPGPDATASTNPATKINELILKFQLASREPRGPFASWLSNGLVSSQLVIKGFLIGSISLLKRGEFVVILKIWLGRLWGGVTFGDGVCHLW
jgi:hypothetical protein